MVNRKLFRPALTDVKEPPQIQQARPTAVAAVPANNRKKPAPPEQTHAESFYYVKQMQARTPVSVVLLDGEVLHGSVEWYDRDCIKLTRVGDPNLDDLQTQHQVSVQRRRRSVAGRKRKLKRATGTKIEVDASVDRALTRRDPAELAFLFS